MESLNKMYEPRLPIRILGPLHMLDERMKVLPWPDSQNQGHELHMSHMEKSQNSRAKKEKT